MSSTQLGSYRALEGKMASIYEQPLAATHPYGSHSTLPPEVFERSRISIVRIVISLLILLLPLMWVQISLGPVRQQPVVFLTPALFAAILIAPRAVMHALGLLRIAAPFWLCCAGYLVVLLFHSVFAETDAPPMEIISKAYMLVCSFFVALAIRLLSDTGQAGRTLLIAGALGLPAFLLEFWHSTISSDQNPMEATLLLLQTSNLEKFQRFLQDTFNCYTPHLSVAELEVPVYKNVVAQAVYCALALMLAGCVLERGKRGVLITFLTCSYLAILLLLLSRSVLICTSFLILGSLMYFLGGTGQRNRAVLACCICVCFFMLVAGVALGEGGALSEKFQFDHSLQVRMLQYQSAIVDGTDWGGLLFGRGPLKVEGGMRIHNLVLSAFVESGLTGLAMIFGQYLMLFLLARALWHRTHQYRDGRPEVAIAFLLLLICPLLRTMISGNAGFYDFSALVAVGTALGLCSVELDRPPPL